MALTGQRTTSSLLGGTRYGKTTENADGLAGGRVIAGKARLNSTTARNALGNVSNKNSLPAQENLKKGLKDIPVLGKTRAMTKSNGTSSLKTVPEKPAPVKAKLDVLPKEVVELKVNDHMRLKALPTSPAPMDISAGSGSQAFSRNLLPPNVEDIDQEDYDNPQMVANYVNEIYDYMRELEERYAVHPGYLEKRGITGRMRAILIDWLVQVHVRFHLLQETLYLTIAILDRFLQARDVNRSKLQLVGVTSMLVASKYEEMYAPEIADFVYITDNAYTKSDIRQMETIILKTLDFELGRPLPLHFLRRNSKAGGVDAQQHTLAKYLMELTIIEYSFVHVPPSQVAAAALCLSMKLLNNDNWSVTLTHYSKYSESVVLPFVKKMALLVTKAGVGKLTAIKSKYESSKFMHISTIPELKSQIIKDLAAEANQ